jgi:hypothetical protein
MPSPTSAELRRALVLGLVDAGGFLIGAIAGWQVGAWFGLDFLSTTGWGSDAVLALLPLLVGVGLGRLLTRWLAHRWLAPGAPPP